MTKEKKGEIANEEKGEMTKATVVLDLRGEACPYPALYTGAKLERMAPGDVLEVLADGLCAVEGIPAAVSQSGYKLLGVETVKNGVYRFIIEVI